MLTDDDENAIELDGMNSNDRESDDIDNDGDLDADDDGDIGDDNAIDSNATNVSLSYVRRRKCNENVPVCEKKRKRESYRRVNKSKKTIFHIICIDTNEYGIVYMLNIFIHFYFIYFKCLYSNVFCLFSTYVCSLLLFVHL